MSPFVAFMLAMVLTWKAPDPIEVRTRNLTRVLNTLESECARYEKLTKIRVRTCVVLSINTAYWESGFQERFQTTGKGPSGEECFFQLHRSIGQIPFVEWKPLYPYGEHMGIEHIERCTEDGVRMLMYHAWRCRIDERKIRSNDGIGKTAKLYSEYHQPNNLCETIYRRHTFNRARMARRALIKVQAWEKSENTSN